MRVGLALAMMVWTGAALAQEATAIHFGAGVEIDGPGAGFDLGVLRISAPGRYLLTGTLAEGAVMVDAPDAAVELVLSGVSITNPQGPAILIYEAEAARVMLAPGTENRIADGGDSDFNASLYSRASLEITGDGALDVEGFDEGITSEMHIEIAGGNITIHADEDGINANNDGVSVIAISGGMLTILSDTGDAIDSNGTIEISGGFTYAWGFAEDAESGLDADNGVTISGGILVATGSENGSRMTAITGSQPVLAHTFDAPRPAGGIYAVVKDNAPLIEFAPPVAFENLTVSLPELVAGEVYDLFADNRPAATLTAGGVEVSVFNIRSRPN